MMKFYNYYDNFLIENKKKENLTKFKTKKQFEESYPFFSKMNEFFYYL